jgi:hypothetical protein
MPLSLAGLHETPPMSVLIPPLPSKPPSRLGWRAHPQTKSGRKRTQGMEEKVCPRPLLCVSHSRTMGYCGPCTRDQTGGDSHLTQHASDWPRRQIPPARIYSPSLAPDLPQHVLPFAHLTSVPPIFTTTQAPASTALRQRRPVQLFLSLPNTLP